MKERIDYENLYKQNLASVYRFAYYRLRNKAKAEDVTAEAFKRLLEKKDIKPELAKFWLFKVVRNLIVDEQRETLQVRLDEASIATLAAEESESFDSQLLTEELKKLINQELSTLPPAVQEVILLRVWEGMTFAEVAEVTEEKESTVKLRYYRGLEKLKQNLASKPELQYVKIAALIAGIIAEASNAIYLPKIGLATTVGVAGVSQSSLGAGVALKAAAGLVAVGVTATAGVWAATNYLPTATQAPATHQSSSTQTTTTYSFVSTAGDFILLPFVENYTPLTILEQEKKYLADECGIGVYPKELWPAGVQEYEWQYRYLARGNGERAQLSLSFNAKEKDTAHPTLGEIDIFCSPLEGKSMAQHLNELDYLYVQPSGAFESSSEPEFSVVKKELLRLLGIRTQKVEATFKYVGINGEQAQQKSALYVAKNSKYYLDIISKKSKAAPAELLSAMELAPGEIISSKTILDADPYKVLGDTCVKTYTTYRLPSFKLKYDECKWRVAADIPGTFTSWLNRTGNQGKIELLNSEGKLFFTFANYPDGQYGCSVNKAKMLNKYVGRNATSETNSYWYGNLILPGTDKYNFIVSQGYTEIKNPGYCASDWDYTIYDSKGTHLVVGVYYQGTDVKSADAVIKQYKIFPLAKAGG